MDPASHPPGDAATANTGRLATPIEVLGILAQSDVAITPELTHTEMFTRRGLLTMLWHHPSAPAINASARPAVAVIACGGAMGGLLGPGEALYHQLGVALSRVGAAMIRVGYRQPNDLDACCLDVAAAVQMAAADGAERVVVMGHSFGGAVSVRVGVILNDVVSGVVTFATQSAGCEIAAGLGGVPLLMFHGDRDDILPVQASQVVASIAGNADVHVIAGDGHLLARSGPSLWEVLAEWLPTVFGPEFSIGPYPT